LRDDRDETFGGAPLLDLVRDERLYFCVTGESPPGDKLPPVEKGDLTYVALPEDVLNNAFALEKGESPIILFFNTFLFHKTKMPLKIEDLDIIKDKDMTDEESQLMREVLGEVDCISDTSTEISHRYLLAIVATVLFLILMLPGTDAFFKPYIPNDAYRLIFKAIVVFIIIYLADVAINNWRQDKEVCVR
jgi:hypothetical protein